MENTCVDAFFFIKLIVSFTVWFITAFFFVCLSISWFNCLYYVYYFSKEIVDRDITMVLGQWETQGPPKLCSLSILIPFAQECGTLKVILNHMEILQMSGSEGTLHLSSLRPRRKPQQLLNWPIWGCSCCQAIFL